MGEEELVEMTGPARDLDLARRAYKADDIALSKEAHDGMALLPSAREPHKGSSSQYIRNVVLGGMDGIITTFAIVAGVAGASLDANYVLVLGFANVLADAISMGLGDYTSSKAELQYELAERKREYWEMENYPEGELREMIEIYMSKGFSEEDAENIVRTMAKNKDFFVDHMMVQELGIMPPDPDEAVWKEGLVTFLSFIVFGCVPLLSFLILSATSSSFGVQFGISCALTALTLIVLGLLKSKMSGINYISGTIGVLVTGVLAAAAAYFVGWLLSTVFDVSEGATS
jgi:DNA damage-binding protein 1